MKSINELVNESVRGEGGVFPCHYILDIQGETCVAYEASVSYRDVLLFTDKGTVTLLVDTYGDRNTYEIFDWDFEQ